VAWVMARSFIVQQCVESRFGLPASASTMCSCATTYNATPATVAMARDTLVRMREQADTSRRWADDVR
jgi:hypothetical protein